MSATNAGGYCNAKDDMREDYSQTKCCITLCSFMKCQDVFSHEILSLHANYSRALMNKSIFVNMNLFQMHGIRVIMNNAYI